MNKVLFIVEKQYLCILRKILACTNAGGSGKIGRSGYCQERTDHWDKCRSKWSPLLSQHMDDKNQWPELWSKDIKKFLMQPEHYQYKCGCFGFKRESIRLLRSPSEKQLSSISKSKASSRNWQGRWIQLRFESPPSLYPWFDEEKILTSVSQPLARCMYVVPQPSSTGYSLWMYPGHIYWSI